MTKRWLPGALAALVLAAWALGSASAQTGEFTLAANGPAEKHATAPATVVFELRATNSDPLLQRDVRFLLVNALSGWDATFEPPTMSLKAGESQVGKLKIIVNSTAAPGSYGFEAQAVSTTTNFPVGGSVKFTLIVDPPAPPATNPTPPSFKLTLASPSVHGLPGASVSNRVRIVVENAGADGIRVQARGQGPSYWPPASVSLNGDWIVYDERSEAFTVKIPSDAVPGSLHTVRVTADSPSVEGGARTVEFTVEVDAPTVAEDPRAPTPEPTPPTSESQTSEPATLDASASSGTGAGEPTTADAQLAIILDDDSIEIRPDDFALGTVQIQNTGGSPIDVVLGTTLDLKYPVTFEDGGRYSLAPGGARLVRFSIYAPASAIDDTQQSALLTADPGGSAPFTLSILKAAPASEEAATESVSTVAAPPPSPLDRLVAQYGLATVVAAGVAAGAAGTGAITLAASPNARRTLLWLGIGMYTRLSRPKLLDHPERERLFQTIEHNPGIHFHALQRELAWNTGALTYHLRVLERHQLVVSRRDGILRRFYLVGQAPRTMPVATAPVTGAQVSLSGLRGNVLQTVKDRGSIAQSALAEELGASKQTLNYHVKNLERLGLLRVERVGRDTFLSPAGESAAPAGAAQPPLAFVDGEFSRSDEYR